MSVSNAPFAARLTQAQIEAVVDAQSAALDLRIAREHRPGVLAYFAIAAGMAQMVASVELHARDESGSVFTPVAAPGSE